MTNVIETLPDGTIVAYATSCPLDLFVMLVEESFQDPDLFRDDYED